MKEKKAGRIIILVAFILLLLSNMIWFFLGTVLDKENHENRELAERPTLTLQNYKDFPKNYTAYLNDNLPFRNSLIRLNSATDYFLFRRSSNENVIVGKNNWLFYADKGDGDPVSCYQGTNLLTDEELALLAQNCINQRDYLASLGKEFVIFIVPNKERIYSEYMPDQYGDPADTYRALQIYTYLTENTDLHVVYPYEELMAAKELISENLWCVTDTHWNALGAYVGASALLAELGIDMPAIDSDQITIQAGKESTGDLASMLNLEKELAFSDHVYSLEGYDLHNVEQLEWDWREMIHYHATGADPRTVYIVRDSMCAAMAPYIGSQFTESYMRHRFTFSGPDMLAYDPDIVIYETVERYAGDLATFSVQ